MGITNLRTLRLERGWSQSDVAEFSGLSIKTIQRIEGGQSVPSKDTAKALASVFGRPFSDFLPDPLEVKQETSTLLHLNQIPWRSVLFSILITLLLFYVVKLSRDVQTLSAISSEILAMQSGVLQPSLSEGDRLLESELERQHGAFSDYYGAGKRQELISYHANGDRAHGVSLLELQMLRDIARLISAWRDSKSVISNIQAEVTLQENFYCYLQERTRSDSAEESISKIENCFYSVFSNSDLQMDAEVQDLLDKIITGYQDSASKLSNTRLVFTDTPLN